MKSIRWLTFFLFLFLFPAKSFGQESHLLQSKQDFQPSLVTIKAFTIRSTPAEGGQTEMSGTEQQGNGVIINSSGIIVTNNHIVANSEHILVTLPDGQTLNATVVYTGDSDFCFLKITPPQPLRAIDQADFSRIKIGSHIIALTHHQNILEGTVARLIKNPGSKSIDLIELNLNLQPGDSGGSVFSEQGCLLGLLMARQESDPSKSYAISSHKIWKEYEKFNGSVLVGSKN